MTARGEVYIAAGRQIVGEDASHRGQAKWSCLHVRPENLPGFFAPSRPLYIQTPCLLDIDGCK